MSAKPGFSLIEVLISLAWVMLSAAALATTARAVTSLRSAGERRLAASLVAEQALEEWFAVPPMALRAGALDDEVGGPGGPFRRRQVLRPGPTEGSWEIDIRIVGPGGDEARLRTLRQVPCRPFP